MGKIANYEIDNTPQPTDKVIGTDVGDDNKTKNYTLQSIADFDPVDTLQEVLNAGNVATGSITLLGPSISTLLSIQGVSSFLGDLDVNADIRDNVGGVGTPGQVLKSQGVGNGVLWGDDSQPPLTATKFWYGGPTNIPTESNNILNDETGTGTIMINQIGTSICIIDNRATMRVTHPVGDINLSYGLNALANAQAGSTLNTAVGVSALIQLTTGQRNVAFGGGAAATTNGEDNTAIGFGAMGGLVTSRNTAVGSGSLVNSGDEENVAIGYNSLNSATVGRGNTAVGTRSAENLLGGGNNVVLGRDSGGGITGESNIICIGQNAGSNPGQVGDDSIYIGTGAGINAGTTNVAIGFSAGASAASTSDAIAIGKGATLAFNETICIGSETGQSGQADRCIVIGTRAGNNAFGLPVATDNVMIGTEVCNHPAIPVGPNNVIIGNAAGHAGGGPWQDSIALGSGATTQRSGEFRVTDQTRHINWGLTTATGIGTGGPPYVFPDNQAALLGGLLPGDMYVLDPGVLGLPAIGPVGNGPAIMCTVYP